VSSDAPTDKSFLLLFFKKEALSFCSFLKKRTRKRLDDLASASLG
jgi:thioredoxin-related protein